MPDKLAKIYYLPKGYWKGATALTKLSDAAGVNRTAAKTWLSKQAMWQIYLPAPKRIKRPHFVNAIPNDTHQMDLLYLPHDTIRRKRFKYALTVIDLASRYKDAEPLTQKSAIAVAVALQEMYRRGPLSYPRMSFGVCNTHSAHVKEPTATRELSLAKFCRKPTLILNR